MMLMLKNLEKEFKEKDDKTYEYKKQRAKLFESAHKENDKEDILSREGFIDYFKKLMKLNKETFDKTMSFTDEEYGNIFEELNRIFNDEKPEAPEGVGKVIVDKTLWICLFDKHLESNEMKLLQKIEDWSNKAKDTDLSELYKKELEDNFQNQMPKDDKLLRDDILFNENRLYVFSSLKVETTDSDEYMANIVIIKPQMQNLESNLFKKRSKEKRDQLKRFLTKNPHTDKD